MQPAAPPNSDRLPVRKPLSLNRLECGYRPLAIRYLAMLPPKGEFVRILGQVLPAHLMPGAIHPSMLTVSSIGALRFFCVTLETTRLCMPPFALNQGRHGSLTVHPGFILAVPANASFVNFHRAVEHGAQRHLLTGSNRTKGQNRRFAAVIRLCAACSLPIIRIPVSGFDPFPAPAK
jgi:hypothetical protein